VPVSMALPSLAKRLLSLLFISRSLGWAETLQRWYSNQLAEI
jgi:hypothetical protein